jgi:cobalt/nickel transport system permease protein
VHLIDRYAYSNRIRTVDPAYKAGLAFIVLMLCLLLSEPLVGMMAVGWMFLLAVRLAGIPVRTFGRVLLAEAAFLVLATVGVVISLSVRDPSGISAWMVRLGPIWISSSPEAVSQAIILVTRALGAASAMNFLALTTPLIDIVELLRRWYVPLILIDLMTVIYRFIFVLLETLNRIYIAQDSRLGYHTSYFRAMNSAAMLGSRLFIDAFQRSQRLQLALESRGYDGGDLRVLPSRYTFGHSLVWLSGAAVVSLVLAWIIV